MNRTAPSISVRLAGILAPALLVLAGCGGGDAAAPAAAVNAAPVAAFNGAGSVAAGTPLPFDASATSATDGDALTYSWDFGNGRRGGGKKIAALFADPGSYVVRLTVGDGRGASASVERTVTVTAGPVPTGNVGTLTIVRDSAGALLAGVTVANVAAGAPAVTGADGRATVGADTGVRAVLKFSKAGFADQFKAFTLPAAAESGYLEVVMTPRLASATLADAAAGGTITGSDGASVVFEAGSLVNAAGAAVTGPVDVTITPIDVAANVRAFPGKFEGTRPTGEQGLIESYGTAEFVLTQAGAPVQLAPGRKATIEIPIYTGKNRDGSAVKAGDVYPLWSLDERTGSWIEEGSGTVVASSSPSGFALRGDVMHFTWWNHDQFLFPIAKPKPKCLVDTNADGVLEDLTGTGYCWHAGTGPEQPTPFAPLSAGTDRKHILAEPRTQRIPTWVAEDFTPAGGGKVLPIPADVDITFRSYARNGSFFGTQVVRMGADVEAEVIMVLEPVQDNPGTLAITLPYNDRFAVATRGEADRFTFAAEAGASYDVRVSRGTSSLLGGSVRVIDTAGGNVASGSFGTNGFINVVAAGTAGTMTVEVTAAEAAPGSYRIEVTKLASTASCSNPALLAVPSTGNHAIAANGTLCFDIALVADDVVEIKNAQNLNARGSIRLLAPNGNALAVDSFGTSSFDAMLFRFGVAQSGNYRLLILNTAATAGTINGLAASRLTPAGTLDLSNSASFPGSDNIDRYYLVRPAAASHIAVKLVADTGGQPGATIWPEAITFTTREASARIVQTSPFLLPLVQVFNPGFAFTLSARSAQTIPLDTDLALTTPAPSDVQVYRIDGVAGQEWSAGISYGPSAGSNPVLSIYAPASGQPLVASNRIYRLPDSGPYTVEVKSSSLATGGMPFNMRVNTAAPPEAITLSASIERTPTLALGEVKRYSFNVVQGQLLSLQLASNVLDAVAVLAGGNVYNGFIALDFPATQRNSGPRYVQRSDPAVLTLYGSSGNVARATGPVTLTLQSPAPTPAALGVPFSVSTPPNTLLSYGYAIATAGKHLLCLSYAGATGPGGFSLVNGTVWGPSALFSNYSGDLGTSDLGTSIEAIGELRAGTNTLTLTSGLTTSAIVNARLVALSPATDLSAGASPTSASLAACERRYHRFAATAGQAYTVRVTAAFAGSVRVRKIPDSGDVTVRSDTSVYTIGGTPMALAVGVERLVTFTIPATPAPGGGDYVIEVDGDGDGSSAYSVSLTSP